MGDEQQMEVPLRLIPDSTIGLILAAISSGKPVTVACGGAGVSRQSFYRWLTEDSQLAARYADSLRAQVHARYAK